MPGHSYKGSAIRPYKTVGNLGAALFNNGGGDVGWVWTGANPPFWSMDSFSGGIWNSNDIVAGADRDNTIDFSPGDIASVIGVDAAGNYVTGRSNTLTVT